MGCGGGGSISVSSEPYQEDSSGWVEITNYYATEPSTAYLAGKAFISPDWARCCSGSAEDTGVTVTWTNLTTGISGPTWQYVDYCMWFSICGHEWSANVPLIPGLNEILITATDPSGNRGSATVTIQAPKDTSPPVVSSTVPKNNAVSVPVNVTVIATFSEQLNPATVTTASFLLRDAAGNPIDGLISVSDRIAKVTPGDALEYDMIYTVIITTAVQDPAGNALAVEYQWNFTTATTPDTMPPPVTSVTPADGASCAAIDGSITAMFGEEMDPLTISSSTFLLTDKSGQPVTGWVTYANNTATLDPYLSLAYSSLYRATITTGVKDIAGNALMADYTWTFTPEPTPTGSWQHTATAGAPSARCDQAAVWTGSEMIVWGGMKCSGTEYFKTGGRYDPANNSWVATSTVNAPYYRIRPAAVWTGQEMIVWGGYLAGGYANNNGGRYDPATDTWRSLSTVGAPLWGSEQAVWTGSEMLVWGRYKGSGRYNPATDTWYSMSTVGEPTATGAYTVIWTGSEMIIWGGMNASGGARYNPQSDTWKAVSTTGAPSLRNEHSAVWTGSEMIVWGGRGGAGQVLNDGGRYNPLTDTWTPLSGACAPAARNGHVAVWTGNRMVVWGGLNGQKYFYTGATYDPITDGWVATPMFNTPEARAYASVVWTGNRVIIWGDYYLNTGGSYAP